MTQLQQIKDLVAQIMGEDYKVVLLHKTAFCSQYALIERVNGVEAVFVATNSNANIFQSMSSVSNTITLNHLQRLYVAIEELGR